MHYNFSIAGHRVTRFPAKCSETNFTKKNSVWLLQLTILCWAAGKCTTQKRQYRRLLQDSRDRKKSLQQTNCTELSETMLSVSTMRTNHQRQSFRPLVNSTVDWFMAEHTPASVQNLFQMINVLNLLTIYQLLKSAPNGIIHRIQIRWVWWPFLRLNEVRDICLQESHRVFWSMKWCTVLLEREIVPCQSYSVRRFHCLAGNSAIILSTVQPFSIL